MKKTGKTGIKRQHLLLLSVAVMALVGMAGATGFGGFGRIFARAATPANSYFSYNGMPYNGIPFNGMRGIRAHGPNYSANTIKSYAAVDQCKTTYADSVSSIASGNLGLGINATQVNRADANLQANVSANAMSWDTRISLALFTNAFRNFMLHYLLATRRPNTAEIQGLHAGLSGTTNSLINCMSSNVTARTGRMLPDAASGSMGVGADIGVANGEYGYGARSGMFGMAGMGHGWR